MDCDGFYNQMEILCSVSLSGEEDEQGLNTGFRFFKGSTSSLY